MKSRGCDNADHEQEETSESASRPGAGSQEGPAPFDEHDPSGRRRIRGDEGTGGGKRPTVDARGSASADCLADGKGEVAAYWRGKDHFDRVTYLMRRGELYKIGYSHEPFTRAETLAELDKMGPITVVHLIHSCRAGEIENALQRKFSRKHVGAEWFTLSPEDVALICSVNQCDRMQNLPDSLRPNVPDYQLSLMIPSELANRLRAIAETNGRKLSQEVLLLLERYANNPMLDQLSLEPSTLASCIDHPIIDRKPLKRAPAVIDPPAPKPRGRPRAPTR